MDFLGVPYPIFNNDAAGIFYTERGLNAIKADLLCLLLTNPGERVMLPDFGVGLRDFIFEPNDSILREQVRQRINTQITKFEPRINIQSIEIGVISDQDLISELDDSERILNIKIMFFDPQNIKEVQELRLQVPLSN